MAPRSALVKAASVKAPMPQSLGSNMLATEGNQNPATSYKDLMPANDAGGGLTPTLGISSLPHCDWLPRWEDALFPPDCIFILGSANRRLQGVEPGGVEGVESGL
eukprot:8811411-Pyramimonas_sp.AAC.1